MLLFLFDGLNPVYRQPAVAMVGEAREVSHIGGGQAPGRH